MTATVKDADPARSTVEIQESLNGKFLKSEEEKKEEEDAPFLTGLIEQEEAPAATKLGTDSEAPAHSDLKETCEAVIVEMKEAEEYDHVQALGVNDGGVELANESYEITGIEFGTEGLIVKDDSLDVVIGGDEEFELEGVMVKQDSLEGVSQGDEETKPESTSDVSVGRMEYVLEQVSGVDNVLDDEDGPPSGCEYKVVTDEDETMASSVVGNIPLENKMEEVWPKEDKLEAPGLENDDDDDGTPPERDSTVIKDEAKAVTCAPFESTLLKIKMEDVWPAKGTLSASGLENGDDDADGLPPGLEETVIADKVEPVPPASVESIPLEIKPEEEQPTKDTILAPGLENGDADGPQPGWEAMVVVKVEVDPMPLALVDSIALDIKTEEMLPTEDTLSAPGLEIDDDESGTLRGWDVVAMKECAAEETLVKLEMGKENEEEASTPPGEELVAQSAPCLENDDDDNEPLPGWESVATKDCPAEETLVKLETWKEKEKEEEEHRPSGEESDFQTAPQPPLPCEPPPPTTEMGQVVCGSCRSLLSYPKGAKYVQCLCCQTVSFVLEAHQLGQVYCGGCSMLLMYRFGSPAVKCSGCKFITQITPQNQRPPLSQQGVTLQSQLAQLRPRPTTNLAQ